MRLAISAFAAVLVAHGIAFAQHDVVHVLAPECPRAVDHAALVRILEAELRADGIARVQAGEGEGLVRVELVVENCEDPEIVRVRIVDRTTHKEVERPIDLRGVPDSLRARTMAMATAELLRASWMELAVADPPEPEVEVPPLLRERTIARVASALGDPSERGRSEEPPPRWRTFGIGFAAAARIFSESGLTIIGPRFSVAHGLLGDRVYLRGDAGIQGGAASDAIGSVDIVAVPFSVSAGARVRTSDLQLEMGTRIEGGTAFVAGRPAFADVSAATVWQGFLLGAVSGGLTLRASHNVYASLFVDVGWVFVGFDALAEDRIVTSMGGPTGSLELGLSFMP